MRNGACASALGVCMVIDIRTCVGCQEYTCSSASAFVVCVCRVSDSDMNILLYGIECIFSHPIHLCRAAFVCIGCERVLCVLLYGMLCIFSHPTHVCRALYVRVGCQRVLCVLLHGMLCMFSHPTYLPPRRAPAAVAARVDAVAAAVAAPPPRRRAVAAHVGAVAAAVAARSLAARCARHG